MSGKLYGVGTGPGDKNLLTLLAVETLKKAHVIAVPISGGENVAFNTVEDFIVGKQILNCKMPMTKDKTILNDGYAKTANEICAVLDDEKDVAFITLGDPTVYSTYIYVHNIVKQRGYDVEIINGITSFCAAAAKLSTSLCDRDEPLHIVPASYDITDEMLDLKGNKVLMKSGKKLKDVIELLDKKGKLENSMIVERCSMDGEKVYTDLKNINDCGYFTLLIVKE